MNIRTAALGFLCLLVAPCTVVEAQIIFVNAAAAPGGDGQSWGTAFDSLQLGLAEAAGTPQVDEIWVAAGTYRPTTTNDRAISFQLGDDVFLFGGFDGTEASRFQRDYAANVTILSGDIGLPGDATDNSANVVEADGLTTLTILDGFTITGANGNLPGDALGGGLRLFNGSSTRVRNCIFRDNYADFGGGVALAAGSTSQILNCLFTGNRSQFEGGGAFVSASNPEFINSTFSRNSSVVDINEGAGLSVNGGGSATVSNCIFWENDEGGDLDETAQIGTEAGSTVTVNNSCIQGLTGALGGVGNIGDDPLFVDADGPDNVTGTADDNLRLQPISPCLHVGNAAALPPGTTSDLDNNPRIAVSLDIGAYELQVPELFVRGDANVNGQVTPSDATFMLNALFLGMGTFRCLDAADADDNGATEISDTVLILNYIFNGGPPPLPPFPDPGVDPTDIDDLNCGALIIPPPVDPSYVTAWDENVEVLQGQQDVELFLLATTSAPTECFSLAYRVNGDVVANVDVDFVGTIFPPDKRAAFEMSGLFEEQKTPLGGDELLQVAATFLDDGAGFAPIAFPATERALAGEPLLRLVIDIVPGATIGDNVPILEPVADEDLPKDDRFFNEYCRSSAPGGGGAFVDAQMLMGAGGGMGGDEVEGVKPEAERGEIKVIGGEEFLRGDANGDRNLNLADMTVVPLWLLRGGSEPGCLDAADSNGDGDLDISDTVYLGLYLFGTGPAPEPSSCELNVLSIGCNNSCAGGP